MMDQFAHAIMGGGAEGLHHVPHEPNTRAGDQLAEMR